MSSAPPGNHCGNRVFEWYAAVVMVGMGVMMFLPGNSLQSGQFRHFRLEVMNEFVVAFSVGGIGLMRCVALFLNGNWPHYGPILRIVGAMVGSVVWTLLALVLLANSYILAVPSIGIPTYACMIVFEIYSVYRAGVDTAHTNGR